MSTIPIDENDPNKRGGIPVDKFGMHGTPLLMEDRRTCVIIMLFPPEALRDASREVIEAAMFANGYAMLQSLTDEIFKAYTSDPIDGAAALNVAQALTAHATAQRKG